MNDIIIKLIRKFLYKTGYGIYQVPITDSNVSELQANLNQAGYEIRPNRPIQTNLPLPDTHYYTPLFSPWMHGGYKDLKSYFEATLPHTLVSSDRLYILYILAIQALNNLSGHFYECGVYKGGTATLLAKLISEKRSNKSTKLHLFDTFEGMPETDAKRDHHKKGDFIDTSLEEVRSRIPSADVVEFHKGFIPETFCGLESHNISFAHIDVDIYKSIIDCCEFIYPRMQSGGFLIFDDYGFPTCPGARQAVDEFFMNKAEDPVVLPTGQALIFKV
jgi:O-methyltransferase